LDGLRFLLVLLEMVVAVAGAVFGSRSLGRIGPSSSFMFRNPAWTASGVVIAAVGVLVAGSWSQLPRGILRVILVLWGAGREVRLVELCAGLVEVFSVELEERASPLLEGWWMGSSNHRV